MSSCGTTDKVAVYLTGKTLNWLYGEASLLPSGMTDTSVNTE